MGHSTANNSMNFTIPQTLSQPPHLSRSLQVPRKDNQQAGVSSVDMMALGNAPGTVQRVQLVAQRPAEMRQPQPPFPLQITQSMPMSSSFALNSGGMPQAVSRTENLIDLQSEQNWRPAGRMRGALAGEAYATALRQHMAQATQPAQAPNIISQHMAPSPSPRPTISASSPRNVLLANRMRAHAQLRNQSFMPTNATSITGSATTMLEGQPRGIN